MVPIRAMGEWYPDFMKERNSLRLDNKNVPGPQPTLKKRKGNASLGELMAIAKRASQAVKRPYVDHGELLYDDRGLPK